MADSTIEGKQTAKSRAFVAAKIPIFTVPRFDDDAIKGNLFICEVEASFKSQAMPQYLENEAFCAESSEWSTAFASRIRESLKDCETMRYLSSELKRENNCATGWQAVIKHLSSVDMKVTRALSQWRKLFSLKCDSITTFSSFYSDVREAVNGLKETDSGAIQDEIFMRAYLCKAIDVPELRTHYKALVNKMDETRMEILERIHSDYRTIVSTESLRSEGDLFLGRQSRRTTQTAKERPKTVHPGKQSPYKPKFPPNTGNLIPHNYYPQFKDWYEQMTLPKNQRRPDFESTFRFVHILPREKVGNPKLKKQEGDRLKKGKRDTKRSNPDGKTERSTRRRKKKTSEDDRGRTRSRSRSDSRSRSSNRDDESDERSRKKQSDRTSRRNRQRLKKKTSEKKASEAARVETPPKTKDRPTDRDGKPPLKCENSPLFDSAASSSSSSSDSFNEPPPKKGRKDSKVSSFKNDTKNSSTRKDAKKRGRESSLSSISTSSPLGTRYSRDLSEHSDWDDDDRKVALRDLHLMRKEEREVERKKKKLKGKAKGDKPKPKLKPNSNSNSKTTNSPFNS